VQEQVNTAKKKVRLRRPIVQAKSVDDILLVFAYAAFMFQGVPDPLRVVIRCKGCGKNIPAPVESVPATVALNGPALTTVNFSAFPQQDGLCASGELSLIAWRMAVLRTLASLWILLA
jgi:hypothetical protein